MIYGYCRVSTKHQARDGNSLLAQRKDLADAGAMKIYTDTFTGTMTDRPALTRLLRKLKKGDEFVVTKLDRIARNTSEGIGIIERLTSQGIKVHVLNMGVIDKTPTGKLIMTILLAFAEFERDMIIQRTQEGRAIAMARPGYQNGRPKKYKDSDIQWALDLLQDHSFSQVTNLTGISKSTLIRYRKQQCL